MHRPFVLVSLLGFAPALMANVIENDSREWYEVRQASGASLLASLNASSPIREHGIIYHGHTAWQIDWNFRWNTSGSGLCEITSVTTNLSIKMTLPRLSISTPEGAAEFNRYFPALLKHEEGHKSIALKAAQMIDRSIASLRPLPSCQALEKEANRTALALIESLKQQNIEYDATTKHGCTQGACLAR